MAHKTFIKLSEELKGAAQNVQLGGSYVHHKHPDQTYQVVGFTILEATDEVAVSYSNVEYPDVIFSRPLWSFLEKLDVSGKEISRFQKA